MELAKPGDPLVASNGVVAEAQGRREPEYSLETPIAKNIKPKVVRSVRELNADAQTQTVIQAVLVYHLLGVGENEIAYVLGTDPDSIRQIKSMPAFQDTFEMLFKGLLTTNSVSLQARLHSMAGRALTNLMELADEKPVEVTELDGAGNEFVTKHYAVPPVVIMKSNDSILDRAGLHPEQLYAEHENEQVHQLEIEVVSADDNKTTVNINVGKVNK